MDHPLRIIETAALPWWNASAYYAVELSRGLAARGHRVIFLGIPGSSPFEKARLGGVEVREMIDLRRNYPVGFLSTVIRLVRLFGEFRPDVINAHQGEGHVLCSLAARWGPVRPIIVRTRADIRKPKSHPLGKVLYERYTDAVVTSGKFMIEEGYFNGFTFEAGKVRNIYAGVDTDHFHPLGGEIAIRHGLGMGREAIVVGIAGRLSPVKGHHIFLRAAIRVATERDGVHFLIAGEEAQVKREALMRTAIAGGIAGKVHFAGRYPDVRPLMDCIDIGVIASLGSEAVSRAAVEFMAMKKPVVSTTAGVLPEVVADGETGFLVPAGDDSAMAEAILTLCRQPEKRKAMGEAGRRRVRAHFSLSEMIEKTEALYLELLERKRSGNPLAPRDIPEAARPLSERRL